MANFLREAKTGEKVFHLYEGILSLDKLRDMLELPNAKFKAINDPDGELRHIMVSWMEEDPKPKTYTQDFSE